MENPIWKIGLFTKISKDEAQCDICKQEGKTKCVFKLSHASVKSLLIHMKMHPEYLEKYNSLKPGPSSQENKIDKFVTVTSGGIFLLFQSFV